MSKRIAIIGGGFAGMAACYSLREHEVTLFDPLPPEESASGLSAGLLHPYIGRRARKARLADEGMASTRSLLDLASKSLGRLVYRADGILRLPIDARQEADFRACARAHPDAEWWEKERVLDYLPQSEAWPGLYISSGIAVDTASYLEGVRLACSHAQFVKKTIESVDELRGAFDQILVTAGAASAHLLPDVEPKIEPVRGEILTLAWPDDLPMPRLPVCMPKYLIPKLESKSCLLGATYERSTKSDKNPLLPTAARLYPQIIDIQVLERKSGLRATLPGHHPPSWIRVDPQVWRFAGLGSRGLLYHALLVKNYLL